MTNAPATFEVDAGSVSDILKTISIPPCPAVVTALLDEARQPEVDFHKITRLISGDVGLAASMMKTANSPLFGLRNKVTTVQHAAAVLGLKNIINIVKGLALQRALSPNGVNMERFWERSSYHAMVSSHLARRVPGVSREDAYSFGLFHDCGIPILMQRFAGYKETLALSNQSGKPIWEHENERHGTDHLTVGSMLARNWQLPDLLVRTIRMHHAFEILDHGNQPDLPEEVRGLTAISLLADRLIAKFLGVPEEAEWAAHGEAVMNYLNYDAEELEELQGDINDDLRMAQQDRSL